MHYLKFYITPEDIHNKLSEEEKKKFNRCVPIDVHREENGIVEMTYILFKDEEEVVQRQSDQPRHRFFNDVTRVGD